MPVFAALQEKPCDEQARRLDNAPERELGAHKDVPLAGKRHLARIKFSVLAHNGPYGATKAEFPYRSLAFMERQFSPVPLASLESNQPDASEKPRVALAKAFRAGHDGVPFLDLPGLAYLVSLFVHVISSRFRNPCTWRIFPPRGT